MTSKSSSTSVTTSTAAEIPDPRRWKALALLSLAQFVVTLFRHINHRSNITNYSTTLWLLSN
jgi:hypothetical protein